MSDRNPLAIAFGDEENVDFAEVKAKLIAFTHRVIGADLVKRNRILLQKQIFGLVEILLCKIIDDSGFIDDQSGDNFTKAMKEVNWYGPSCTWEETDLIFVDTFVTLASHYMSSAPLLLEILTTAACNLSPPDKNHMLLRRILLGYASIIRFSSLQEDILFGRSDKVIVEELLTGLTCIPVLASGKVFIILSLMRVVVESRYRSTFGFFLRRTLISIMSKTWLKQPLRQVSMLYNRHLTQVSVKPMNTLYEVTNNVADNMYHDCGGTLGNTESSSGQLTELLEPAILNQRVLEMAPQRRDNAESSIWSDQDVASNSSKSTVDASFTLELAEWREKCTSDPQLTSTVLFRVASWFSPMSPTRLNQLSDNSEEKKLSGTIFNTVVIDVVKWAIDATTVIFKDFSVFDIPLVVPSWTGVNLYRVSEKSKSSDKVHRLKKKYDSFLTKFSVLKIFILCCSSGSLLSIELLLDYLVTKLEKFIGIEVGKSTETYSFCEGIDFFRFLIILEFVIQLLTSLSPRVLELHTIVKSTQRLTSIAQAIKQNLSMHISPVSSLHNTGTPTADCTAKSDLSSLKCNMYAYMALCSGIGYTLTQRFSSDDLVAFLIYNTGWDVSNAVSSLFLSHLSGDGSMNSFVQNMSLWNFEENAVHWNCKYFLVAHPAIEIILNVFFMPHIGTEDYDKTLMKTLCAYCSRLQIDPKDDFSQLNLSNVFDFLPFGNATLGHLFVPSEISKLRRDKDNAAHLLPNLRYLSNGDFCRLAKQLASRFEGSIKAERRISSHSEQRVSVDGMDLSTFSKDVLVQILSFLSFKRVCRMACVSSGVSEASREISLWEILYKRKFRNYMFESCLVEQSAPLMTKLPICNECFVLKPSATKSRTKKQKPCHFDCRQHSWMSLFQAKATTSRKLMILNSKKDPSKQISPCPFVGCLFSSHKKSTYENHVLRHTAKR